MADRVVMTNPAVGAGQKVVSRRAFDKVHSQNGWQEVPDADQREASRADSTVVVPLEAQNPAGLRLIARKRAVDVDDIEPGEGEKVALIERLRANEPQPEPVVEPVPEPAPRAPRATAAPEAAPAAAEPEQEQ